MTVDIYGHLYQRIADIEARIAQLEAENNRLQAKLRSARSATGIATADRITELEGERDRMQAERDYNRTAHDSAILRIAQLTKHLAELEARWRDEKAEVDRLKEALRPFARLTKVEQARTAVIAEDDLIIVIVRAGDIEAARTALSGEEAK